MDPGQRHIGPQLETSAGEPGDTHAYDARTGKELWEFHTIPREGEPGNETWGFDSWKNRTGNNVWAFALTVDEAARHRLPSRQQSGSELLRRRPAGKQSLRQFDRRTRYRNGKAQMVLPNDPSRTVGLQPSACTEPVRSHQRRQKDSRARANRQSRAGFSFSIA